MKSKPGRKKLVGLVKFRLYLLLIAGKNITVRLTHMVKISYVYPNVSKRRGSQQPQRGGLVERWHSSKCSGCEFIEVPADFVKSGEESVTSLLAGSFITKDAVQILYTKDESIQKELKYVLHTDPELKPHHKLRWDSLEWRKQFTKMLGNISNHFGQPPTIIEIHPSERIANPYTHIVEGIKSILDFFHENTNSKPLVLLENRTDKQISNGREIRDFWSYLTENDRKLRDEVGIVLDIQTLYTQNRHDLEKRKVSSVKSVAASFLKDLDRIPLEALRGFHIHGHGGKAHQIPSEEDALPWKEAFQKITQTDKDIIVNPEVLNKSFVKPTIDFCQMMLMRREAHLNE